MTKEFATSTKTRLLYSLTSLGITIPGEAVAGVIAFYIVDIKKPACGMVFDLLVFLHDLQRAEQSRAWLHV
jgi:hypothetical protein